MSLIFIPGNAPSYAVNSSDLKTSGSVTSGSTNHAVYRGARLINLDTQQQFIISDDLSLVSYAPSVGGFSVTSSASFIAGSGSTVAYSINDVVSAGSPTSLLTFSGMGRYPGGGGLIDKVRIITSASADVSQYNLHLFNVTSASPTVAANNGLFQLIYASGSAGHVGKITTTAMTTEALGSNAAESITVGGSGNLALQYHCGSGDTSLYGVLQTLTAVTSASPSYNIVLHSFLD